MLTINLQQTIDISKQHFTDHSGFNTRKICVNPFPSKDVSIRPMFCHATTKDFCKELLGYPWSEQSNWHALQMPVGTCSVLMG